MSSVSCNMPIERRATTSAGSCTSALDGLDPGLRNLYQHFPDTIVRYDRDGLIVSVNDEFVHRTGHTIDQVVGSRPFEWAGEQELVPDVAEYRALLTETLTTGEPRQMTRTRRANGPLQIYQVRFFADLDDAGEVVGAFAVANNVSELEQARDEIARREHEFRTLSENLPDIVIRYDGDARATYVNRSVDLPSAPDRSSLLGKTPTETTGHGINDLVAYEACLRRVLATGVSETIDMTFVDSSGADRVHSLLFRAERSPSGTVVGAIAFGRDITDLVRAREAIAEREREFRTLAENLPDVLVRYDRNGRVSYANHQFELQVYAGEVIGRTPDEIDPPGHHGGYRACLSRVLTTGEAGEVTITVINPAGEHRVHIVSIRSEYDNQNEIKGAIAIGRDVTELMRAQQHVTYSERQFRTLAENATDFIGRWDREARRVYVNPALAVLMGGSPDSLLGHRSVGGPTGQFTEISQAIHRCIAEARPLTAEQRYVDRETGEQRIHDVQLIPEFDADGALESVLVIGREVTEVVQQREALERAARTDALTGVSSRQVLYERLPGILDERRAAGGRTAVLLLDLDGFKNVNDQYGHRIGDRILRRVGRRLAECVGPDDLLVRVGGDEFVIVLADLDGPTEASLLAYQARLGLAALEHDTDERYPPVDASVGIAMFPEHGDDVDVLLAHADLALYDAKGAGRGRVEFFRAELRAAMERRTALEQALRDCVPDTEMALHLQPICDIGSDPQVWGAEALLRWNHPALGSVAPAEFISIAEQSGQIVPIGRWVLRRAAEIAVTLNRDRSRPLRIAVNVSTRQFTLDDIGDAVRDALAVTGCDPRWMIIELTESLLLEDLPLVNRSLEALRSLGVAIAIDDFGTGYSSLHYLTRLSIDHMKVDKAFVRDADVDCQQQEIVRALVAMAHAIGIEVVAEGIETQGQADLLRALGCRLGQGYLLARPMPVDQFDRWLTTAAISLREALPV